MVLARVVALILLVVTFFYAYRLLSGFVNKVKTLISGRTLIHCPLSVFLDSNNWYQSLAPWNKSNSLRKILYPESMEMSLQKELEVALEDYDVERLKNLKLQDELNSTKEFILTL